MVVFNWIGVLGMLIGAGFGVAAGAAADWLKVPLSEGQIIFYSFLLGVFAAAIFGLSIDRCDFFSVWTGYKSNLSQFFRGFGGQPPHPVFGYNPRRRIAFCVWPLALGPALLLFVAVLFCAIDKIGGYRIFENADYAAFLAVAVGTTLLAYVYAHATRRLRYVGNAAIDQRETSLLAVNAVAAGPEPNCPTIPTPPRRLAIVVFLFGVGGLVVNHLIAVNHNELFVILVLLCPMLAALGLGGIIDPRVLLALREEGRCYPKWVRLVATAWALIGLGATIYLAFFVYRLGR